MMNVFLLEPESLAQKGAEPLSQLLRELKVLICECVYKSITWSRLFNLRLCIGFRADALMRPLGNLLN